jgi:hypothetical protein
MRNITPELERFVGEDDVEPHRLFIEEDAKFVSNLDT